MKYLVFLVTLSTITSLYSLDHRLVPYPKSPRTHRRHTSIIDPSLFKELNELEIEQLDLPKKPIGAIDIYLQEFPEPIRDRTVSEIVTVCSLCCQIQFTPPGIIINPGSLQQSLMDHDLGDKTKNENFDALRNNKLLIEKNKEELFKACIIQLITKKIFPEQWTLSSSYQIKTDEIESYIKDYAFLSPLQKFFQRVQGLSLDAQQYRAKQKEFLENYVKPLHTILQQSLSSSAQE